ncbi:MAG: type II toxin-antitoxin system VapC family toxin [Pleurocapsa sp. SU_196_0]|nr:type II toxin-antitoxin system VapC family toxin [Pleurocapsa sp. SU_196_0]
MRIYLDSCILIYLIEGTRAQVENIRSVMASLPDNTDLCISNLVRLECLVKPYKLRDAALEHRYQQEFPAFTTLYALPIMFDRAALYRAQRALKTPDALHLATAALSGCTEFWSNDSRLNGVASGVHIRAF